MNAVAVTAESIEDASLVNQTRFTFTTSLKIVIHAGPCMHCNEEIQPLLRGENYEYSDCNFDITQRDGMTTFSLCGEGTTFDITVSASECVAALKFWIESGVVSGSSASMEEAEERLSAPNLDALGIGPIVDLSRLRAAGGRWLEEIEVDEQEALGERFDHCKIEPEQVRKDRHADSDEENGIEEEGLNLAEATQCIFIEPRWSDAVDRQAKARCQRFIEPNQVLAETNPVEKDHLKAKEEKKKAREEKKKELAERKKALDARKDARKKKAAIKAVEKEKKAEEKERKAAARAKVMADYENSSSHGWTVINEDGTHFCGCENKGDSNTVLIKNHKTKEYRFVCPEHANADIYTLDPDWQ